MNTGAEVEVGFRSLRLDLNAHAFSLRFGIDCHLAWWQTMTVWINAVQAQTLKHRLSLCSPVAMSQERSRQGAVAAQVIKIFFELFAQQPVPFLCIRFRELRSR